MSTALAVQWIDEHRQRLIELANEIWNYAEVGLREFRSAEALIAELEKAGFAVERGVAGMPSAFVATYGSGRPVIGLLGEYDALPGLSQKVTASREPVEPGAPGHGCGHNLLGVGVLGGALALKSAMKSAGMAGTLQYFGCPAEETLVGKVFMARDGLFDSLDAALTWHPWAINGAWLLGSTALNSVKFNFHGVAAHAAANPDMGRSALDAVQLMDMGVNYLREHVIPEARIHCVITKGGGEPNIVPAEAQIWYYVRAPKRRQVESIYSRVIDCARGAALMPGTTFDVEFIVGCYHYAPNRVLAGVVAEAMALAGYELLTRPEILREARAEFERMIAKEGAYTPPIPADLKPPLDLLQH